MTPFIELNRSQFESIIMLLQKHHDKLFPVADIPPVASMRINGVGMFNDGTGSLTYEITYRINERENTIDIHVEPVGYAVIKHQQFPPFDLTAKLGKNVFDEVKFVKYPKDMQTFRFLMSKTGNDFNGTNAEYIMFMCHCAMYVLTVFPYAMDTIFHGDKLYYTPKKDFIHIANDGMETNARKIIMEKALDGWDCINLKWEQLTKLWDMFDRRETEESFSTIALEKFATRITMDNIMLLFFYDYNPNTKKMTIAFTTEQGISLKIPTFTLRFSPIANPITGELHLNYWYDNEDDVPEYIREKLEDHFEKNGKGVWSLLDTLVVTFLYVNHFMLYYKAEATDVEEKVCKHRSDVRKNKHPNRGSVRMFKSYTLKKNWKSQVKRKKAEFKCLAWGVRGHFRHYKSGKVVFVNAFVKGKERDKYKGKDYVLPPSNAM